jgi:hypothetical protein
MTWARSRSFQASDGFAYDNFGHSVSIDGELLLVGSFRDDDDGADSGSAYVFTLAELPPCYGWDRSMGNPGVEDSVRAMTVHDDGTGPALYGGGLFVEAGGVTARSVAKYLGGNQWEQVGPGLANFGQPHEAWVFGLGSYAGNLYVGGENLLVIDDQVENVVRWDGTQWHALGSGVQSTEGSHHRLRIQDVRRRQRGEALHRRQLHRRRRSTPINRIAAWGRRELVPAGFGSDARAVGHLSRSCDLRARRRYGTRVVRLGHLQPCGRRACQPHRQVGFRYGDVVRPGRGYVGQRCLPRPVGLRHGLLERQISTPAARSSTRTALK